MGIPSLVCMRGPEGDGTVRFLAGWSPPAAQGEGSLLFRLLLWLASFHPCAVWMWQM